MAAGAAPGVELPTVLVAIDRVGLAADDLDTRLRALIRRSLPGSPMGKVVLDLRTVDVADDERLSQLLVDM